MRLSVEEMNDWARDFYVRVDRPFKKNVNWSRVARDGGWSPTRIGVQRTRKEIDAILLIKLAHTFGVNPLEELGRIPRWHHLAGFKSEPSTLEILSSLHPRYAIHEVANRLGPHTPHAIKMEPWDSYDARFSTWFDVTGGEAAKNLLAEAIQVASPSAMSARLNSHSKFHVDDILDGFTAARMDPIYALVLAGYITDEEAGYSLTLREESLVSVANDELIYIMQKQMRFTARMLAGGQSTDRLTDAIE